MSYHGYLAANLRKKLYRDIDFAGEVPVKVSSMLSANREAGGNESSGYPILRWLHICRLEEEAFILMKCIGRRQECNWAGLC